MTAKEYNDCIALWADDVMRFAMRCGHNREDGEDAVQEAFAAMWTKRADVDRERGKSFLFSTVYRQMLWHIRDRKAERQHMEAMEVGGVQLPDTSFDLREAIERSLQGLPEVQRAILQLRDVEGYTYNEIGETLSLTADQVQVYLFRARVAMRKQLKQMGYDNNR